MPIAFVSDFFHNFRSPQSPADQRYQVYTDGGHKGRWGSWAYVVIQEETLVSEKSGRQRNTGSNAMELQAIVQALHSLPRGSGVDLYTDSRIAIETATKQISNGHSTDQLLALSKAMQTLNISWHWVRAHSGIRHNERCDELCILAREGKFKKN